MRMNPFATDQGILTAEELLYIEEKVVETFRFVLQARSIFPVINIGQGGGKETYRFYTETDPSGAQIDMTGKAQSEDHPEKVAHDIVVPVIHKEFFLNWRTIASSRTVGPSLLDDSIRTATRMVAESEDRLLISGEYLPAQLRIPCSATIDASPDNKVNGYSDSSDNVRDLDDIVVLYVCWWSFLCGSR